MIPERFHRLRAVLDRRQPDLTVLMEHVHKPHNLSAILRNCDAVGVLEIHAVPPPEGLQLHHGTSAGSSKWVGVNTHPDLGGAVDRLHETGFQIVAAHPAEDATDYRELDFTRPTAILMGSELDGLTDEALERADRAVAVPMVGMVHSLNVSVATSLLLYEAFRQRDAAGMYDAPRLEPGRYERLLFEWAHPRAAARLRESGRPYPPLDDDGHIVR